MKPLFKLREFVWVIVSEIEDWVYPYRTRLSPEEKYEHEMKDKKAAKKIIKIAKTEPMLYTKEDVRYAKQLRKAIKYEEQRHIENQSK